MFPVVGRFESAALTCVAGRPRAAWRPGDPPTLTFQQIPQLRRERS
jgi:hypothetical protein